VFMHIRHALWDDEATIRGKEKEKATQAVKNHSPH